MTVTKTEPAATPPAPAAAASPSTPPAAAPTTPEAPPQTGAAEGTPPPAEGTQPPATPAAEPPATPPPAAELELKLPEGMQADPQLLEGFRTLAKEHGLPAEKAQGMVDAYVAAQQRAAEAAQAQFAQTLTGWETEVRADPEIGGEKYEASLQLATRAFSRFGSEKLTGLLERTGLGSHPEIIRLGAAVGRAMAEDSVAGTQTGGTNHTGSGLSELASALYGNSMRKG